jgi:uncharacterized protein (TIGR00299 family) protein
VKILYFDCPMGISGDMFLGALIDLGVDIKEIVAGLATLPLDMNNPDNRFDVSATRVRRHSITGTTFRVKFAHSHHHRTYRDIKGLIKASGLKKGAKDLSLAIFRTIAEAEARIHGIKADEVHFHEIGAMDSIVDIIGAAIALDSLGIDRFIASPIALGSGWAKTMHGTIPIPAPATLEILKGVPTLSGSAPFELTTPTGAAIVKTVADSFGPMPPMVIEKTGYGAGKKDFKDAANLLRLIIGSGADNEPRNERQAQSLVVLETNIDDQTPQLSGYMMDVLLEAGALDVYITPIQMKKNRPGILLTVLASQQDGDALVDIIFKESFAIGVRSYPVERRCLDRRIEKVRTRWGVVRVKIASLNGVILNRQPEYEDCKSLAEKKGVPLKKVMEAAISAMKDRL